MAGGLVAASTALAPEPVFPAHSTLLLVCGVPGDSENERAYNEQLQAWLDAAAESGQVERALVLCDNAAQMQPPARLNATLQRADRNHFLALGQTLSTNRGPVVAVVWGHGGNQGATPVFHVRGPRITPLDFKIVAASITGDSRWICFFRGSGLFAREIAGPRRTVLSSDRDGVFTSDPVGMAVFLKLRHNHPAANFADLADQLGRATTAWYAERRLARTEEPTLWNDELPPRLLAPAADSDAPSVDTTQGKGTVLAADKPGTNFVKSAKTVMPGDLPAAWRELKKVTAADFPDADGAVLKQAILCSLGHDPAVVREQEEYIQVLTLEGKALGDFDVSYSPPDEDIEFLDCEVLRPDGRLVTLDSDDIGEASQPDVGDYQAGRRKFFSLPGVVPGAILHVRYRTQWKRFPLPQISMELPLADDLPVLVSSVEVRVPSDAAFHFAFEDVAGADPEVKQSAYSTTYRWKFEKLPARRREVLTSPHKRPRLLVSTFLDWKAFAGWYGRLSRLTDEVTPEIAAKAKELTADAKGERERVLAIYNYVTNLRYVAIPLGVNSFRPHAAGNVLQNQFGDCKDKANLFNALLHSVGVQAHLVLVPRFSQAYDGVPGLAFNHAISQALVDGQTLWVDTTDDVCRFGLLPPGDPGRKVLVIDGESAALVSLPTPQSSEHRLELRGQATCAGSTEAIPMSLTATAFGFPDYELRNVAKEGRQHRGAMPLLAAHYRPVSGSFALEKQRATPVSALRETFTWQAEGSCVGLSPPAGKAGFLHAPFWIPKEWDAALHDRQSPLYLNQGYPLTLEEKFEIRLPPGAQTTSLPPLSEALDEPLRWRIQWAKIGEDQVLAQFHAELCRGELSADETSVFQQQLRRLFARLGADAAFSLSP